MKYNCKHCGKEVNEMIHNDCASCWRYVPNDCNGVIGDNPYCQDCCRKLGYSNLMKG